MKTYRSVIIQLRIFDGPAAVQEEARTIMEKAGWSVERSKEMTHAYTARLEKQELYLHPSGFVGELLENGIPQLKLILAQAHTFQISELQLGEAYYDMTPDECEAMLLDRQEDIISAVLEQCRTKRKNQYVPEEVLHHIAASFAVRHIEDRRCCGNGQTDKFIAEIVERLVSEGRLSRKITSKGSGLRTECGREFDQLTIEVESA